MDYLLFTYPNCDKCDAFKSYLKGTSSEGTPLQGEELSLVEKAGKMRIREYLGQIKRDEKGAIILPVFVLREEGRVSGIFTDYAEFDRWLRSRA
jgi:glutaredoxin